MPSKIDSISNIFLLFLHNLHRSETKLPLSRFFLFFPSPPPTKFAPIKDKVPPFSKDSWRLKIIDPRKTQSTYMVQHLSQLSISNPWNYPGKLLTFTAKDDSEVKPMVYLSVDIRPLKLDFRFPALVMKIVPCLIIQKKKKKKFHYLPELVFSCLFKINFRCFKSQENVWNGQNMHSHAKTTKEFIRQSHKI